jgi:ketosteroid isomerase-like protein
MHAMHFAYKHSEYQYFINFHGHKNLPLMKKIITALAMHILLLFTACKPPVSHLGDAAAEKQAVQAEAENWVKWVSANNADSTVALFADSAELRIFGSDSTDFFTTKDQLKRHMEVNAKLGMQTIRTGVFRHVLITLSNTHDLANMVFEIPWDIRIGGQDMHALIRYSMTMKKQEGRWRIVTIMDQFATVGQSSEEMLKQMEQQSPME